MWKGLEGNNTEFVSHPGRSVPLLTIENAMRSVNDDEQPNNNNNKIERTAFMKVSEKN